MNLLETIARRELEGLMDIKIIGELDNRYLWVDICLAKIEYAYYHYLKDIYSKEKKSKNRARYHMETLAQNYE
jgi:hypothetical protein